LVFLICTVLLANQPEQSMRLDRFAGPGPFGADLRIARALHGLVVSEDATKDLGFRLAH
jgi:hypothetical protein